MNTDDSLIKMVHQEEYRESWIRASLGSDGGLNVRVIVAGREKTAACVWEGNNILDARTAIDEAHYKRDRRKTS